MAKEEPDEWAEQIGNANRLCSQKSPDISLRSFQSRLAQWREQCLRFQSSGETWAPTKPCCPACPYLGLEAILWQGCKKHEPTPCVQLLSIQELLELYEFFRENPQHGFFEDSGSEPRLDVGCDLQMRPWIRDLPRVRAGGGYELAEDGMLKLSPSSGSAAQFHEGSTEPGEKHSEAVEPRPGGPAPKRQRAGNRQAQPRDTATKKRAHGSTTKVSGKAEAQKLKRKPVTPRTKAQELAKKSKEKPMGSKVVLSAVKGVYFRKNKRSSCSWQVHFYNPSSQKTVYGGTFKVQREAEAKARKLAKELGLRTERKLVSAAASYFEPLGTQKGITWHRGGWSARFYKSEDRKRTCVRFTPDDLSTKGVEKAWKKAVAWRWQQEKQQLKQASKR